MMDKIVLLTSEVGWERVSFWEDPRGWIAQGVVEGLCSFFEKAFNVTIDFLNATSDTFTLFALLFLIMAEVMGMDTAKRYRGFVIVSWLFIKSIAAFNGRL